MAWLMDVNAGTSEYLMVLFTGSEGFFTGMEEFMVYHFAFRVSVGNVCFP
jgi:hypothetical protein